MGREATRTTKNDDNDAATTATTTARIPTAAAAKAVLFSDEVKSGLNKRHKYHGRHTVTTDDGIFFLYYRF